MPQAESDNLTVFEHMKQLGTINGNQAGVFTQYIKGATFMIQTPKLFDQVIQMIDKPVLEPSKSLKRDYEVPPL